VVGVQNPNRNPTLIAAAELASTTIIVDFVILNCTVCARRRTVVATHTLVLSTLII
jgi:hypothetical protein